MLVSAAQQSESAMRACMLSRFSHVQLFAVLWTVACQAPLSMGSSRHEHWSGLPCPSLGDLPNPEMELISLVSPALADRFFTTSTTVETLRLPHNTAFPRLGIYPEKTMIQKDTHTPAFIVSLFITSSLGPGILIGHNPYWAHTLHVFIHSFKLLPLLASTYYVGNCGAIGLKKKKKKLCFGCLSSDLAFCISHFHT